MMMMMRKTMRMKRRRTRNSRMRRKRNNVAEPEHNLGSQHEKDIEIRGTAKGNLKEQAHN
jgi:hypothetical protein